MDYSTTTFPDITIPWVNTKQMGWCRARIYRTPTKYAIKVWQSSHTPTTITSDTNRILEHWANPWEPIYFTTPSRLKASLRHNEISDLLNAYQWKTLEYNIEQDKCATRQSA